MPVKSRPTTGDDDQAAVEEQFRSLMEGLRTSLPGAQVLFAFLLTAPLQSSFAEVSVPERIAFAIAFFSSAGASVLLIAPSVHQRVRAPLTGLPRQSKVHLIWTTWVTIAGSILLGIAMLATVLLVSMLVFNSTTALVSTAAGTTIVLWSWLYLPLVTFRRLGESDA